MKTIFWGAGQIGKKRFELWDKLGLKVDYFGDNDPTKEGTYYCGLEVISPDRVLHMEDYKIHITCSQRYVEEVFQELINKGIDSSKIVLDYGLISIFYKLTQELSQNNIPESTGNKIDILFDLQNGFALGGVETWTFDSVDLITERNYSAGYLVNSYSNNWYLPKHGEIVDIPNLPEMDFFDHSLLCAKKILDMQPKIIIINFPQTIFLAACAVKALFPNDIKVIAVVHNDEKTYYDLYSAFEKYIDCFWIISNKIRDGLSSKGINKEKMIYLPWYIPCKDELVREYSNDKSPIKLGYAGRITIIQKRVDLLIELALKIKEKNIDFIFEIAGDGDYIEQLKNKINFYKLNDVVIVKNYISHDEIYDFWINKDIAINLSDFEGRSISKAEAMAAGVVPIMTDTSGMSDDIKEGYNGFLVPLEDVELAAQRVEMLYNDRNYLQLMGKRAYGAIKANNTKEGVVEFWDLIEKNYLEKVYES